jgi:lactoylglutathione lyase
MLRKIDCIMIRVPDVDVAAAYYTKVSGLLPQWSGDNMVGLEFPESDVEIGLHSDAAIPSPVEVYYLVDDVVAALTLFGAEGCHVDVAPLDITVGKCAVIKDPFGTRLCLLDLTKGLRPNNRAGSKNSRADV